MACVSVCHWPLLLYMLSDQVMVHLLMVVGHHGLARHVLRHVVMVQ